MSRCEWTRNDDGIYDTSCGHSFTTECDDMSWANYCCFCGKILKETIKTEEEPEDV